jgi:hypothetical protein|tara:strand:- start:4441 stop:5229 length:789 start_codon:yes stop_codon:yes gene_type:complete
MNELDPALAEFLRRYLTVNIDPETGEATVPNVYFRFMRGRNASQARSCGVAKIDASLDPDETARDIVELSERLQAEEYRMPPGDRARIYLQVVAHGATRHHDWVCVFDAGSTEDALGLGKHPQGMGIELAGRTMQAVVVELMRQNRSLFDRNTSLIDNTISMAMNVGHGGSDMANALESLSPTLEAIGQNLPAILAARAAAAAKNTAPAAPQAEQTAEEMLAEIKAKAHQLATLYMTGKAELDKDTKRELRELSKIINAAIR